MDMDSIITVSQPDYSGGEIQNDFFGTKTGRNAIGMTAEFDAADKKSLDSIRKDYFANDPAGFEEYKQASAAEFSAKRETIRKYELQQTREYALKYPEEQLNKMSMNFESWANMENERIQIAAQSQANTMADLMKSRINYDSGIIGDSKTANNNAESAAKAALETIAMETASYKTKEYGNVVSSFNTMFNNMYSAMTSNYKIAGLDDDQAHNMASMKIGKKAKAMIDGFIANGKMDLAKLLIAKYGDESAIAIPEVDENGQVKKDKDGMVVYSKDKINPMGRLCMTNDDIGGLRSAYEQKIAAIAKKNAFIETQNEEKAMLEADRLNTIGLGLLSNPDSTYDPDALSATVSGLSSLALSSPTSKANTHINTIIKSLTDKAAQMTRRVKNWDESTSALKSSAEYITLLNGIEREGNVGAIAMMTYGNKDQIVSPENIDMYQKMILVVKNGLARGKLKDSEYGENGTSKYSLKELRKNFGKTNWEEAARWLYKSNGDYCGGKIEVDLPRTTTMYKMSISSDKGNVFDNQSNDSKQSWQMADWMFSGEWKVNPETGERTLPNAKYYWFKYTTPDGKVIHMSGDDMETLSKGVHEFQMRSMNPSDKDNGNVHNFIKGIFTDIITKEAMRVGSGADTTLKSGAMSSIVTDRLFKTKGTNIHQIINNFDPFLKIGEKADLTPMYKRLNGNNDNANK